MQNTPFTARNAAKYVVQAIVASRTAELTANTITDYTQFEEDDNIVKIPSTLVGWYVSHKLKPVTDSMVDRTANFITEKRQARAARKAAE